MAVDSTPAASTENPQPEVVRLIPLGANKHPEIVAEGAQECKVNYFRGNDSSKWKTNIPTYQSIVYKDVYKDIDMKFYGNNRQMEYDIIVKPGASPSRVQLAYEGVKDVQVNDNGELEITINSPLKRGDNSYCPPLAGMKGVDGENTSDEGPLGFSLESSKIIQKKPYVYQVIDGKKVEREGRFVIRDRRPSPVKGTRYTGKNNGHGQRCIYGFQVASYDKRYPLVIDPTIVYSTYLGGSGLDRTYNDSIAVDQNGNAYITGWTYSSDFPLQSAYDTSLGGDSDAFVSKIDASGTNLSYSTFLGGSSDEESIDIAVDSDGNIYVTGLTYSADFPTTINAIDESLNGYADAFVTKIDASGTVLSYSTFLGGSGLDEGQGITLDSIGNAYVAGYTESSDFPTKNAFDASYHYQGDAFVAKINSSGTSLLYSTYLGGDDWDVAKGLAVDATGNAYVVGFTGSSDFPTANAMYSSFGGYYDAFVTKIGTSGANLLYSTYLGGNSEDRAESMSLDDAGNVYVTGWTRSSNFPTKNPIKGKRDGAIDAFVTKIDSMGTSLLYSTYLGGSDSDHGMSIAIDVVGNAYVAGYTESSDFPTVSAIYGTNTGGEDAFVTKIDASGTSLLYSTFLGGSNDDFGYGIAVDVAGNAYVTGFTGSSDFPTVNAIDESYNGDLYDVFVTKMAEPLPAPTPSPSPEPSPTGTPTAITLLSFNAKAGENGKVALIWKTATEIDNAGFNIYRARKKDGNYKKVNDLLISANGNATTGADYSYTDTPPAKGKYFYKLEDVDYNGVGTMHGHAKAKVKAQHRAKGKKGK